MLFRFRLPPIADTEDEFRHVLRKARNNRPSVLPGVKLT